MCNILVRGAIPPLKAVKGMRTALDIYKAVPGQC